MVKRTIEQDLRNRNFGARNGNYERNAAVMNQGTKNSWKLLAMGSQRAVFYWRQLQFPSRYQQACTNDTAESVSEFCHAAEWVEHSFIQNRFHPLTLSSKHDFIQ